MLGGRGCVVSLLPLILIPGSIGHALCRLYDLFSIAVSRIAAVVLSVKDLLGNSLWTIGVVEVIFGTALVRWCCVI